MPAHKGQKNEKNEILRLNTGSAEDDKVVEKKDNFQKKILLIIQAFPVSLSLNDSTLTK